MNTRPFGTTGIRASEIGLGCWQLGGTDWGAVDDRRALDILAAAADAGWTFSTRPTCTAAGVARNSSGAS